jgi:hypothetical protein
LCRREDFDRFSEIWREPHPRQRGAVAIDAQLHSERVDVVARAHGRHPASFADLPDGAFVELASAPMLVLGNRLLRWTPVGSTEAERRPSQSSAFLLIPPSLVAVLRAGWSSSVLFLHPSAGAAGRRALSR